MRLSLCVTLTLLSACHANVQETLIGITGKDFILLGADSSIASQGSISWTASQRDKIHMMQPVGSRMRTAAAIVGDSADSDRLVGLLQAHCAIREWEGGVGSDVEYLNENDADAVVGDTVGLSVDAVAHLARAQIAQSLRSQSRMNVCALIAGMYPTQEGEEEDDEAGGVYFAKRLRHQVQQATIEGRLEAAGEKGALPSLALLTSRPRLFWLDQYGSLQKLQYGAHGFAANFLLSILDQGYRPDLTREEALELMRSCFEQLRGRYIIHSPNPPCIKCIDEEHGCQLIE
jgi:20S proteasome alpha/beta subunit